jgi:hypothetical protein
MGRWVSSKLNNKYNKKTNADYIKFVAMTLSYMLQISNKYGSVTALKKCANQKFKP